MLKRGFDHPEFAARLEACQRRMCAYDIDALFVSTEPEINYFTGFLTRFWQSPTRPWYCIIPQSGQPIAVIPAIGAHLMRQSWLQDIRCWDAPDYQDDGIGLLCDAFNDLLHKGARIGVRSDMESHLRMPLDHWKRLQNQCKDFAFVDDQHLLRDQRMIKSQAEIVKIGNACDIANRAFARISEIAREGVPLSKIFREFQALCLQEGADWISYLAGAADQSGYGDVISPATDNPLQAGDILMLDTGLVWDGYFCDFDRNFAIQKATPKAIDAHTKLIEATQSAFEIAKPETTASQLFHAMDKILTGGKAPKGAGRLGHGLGLQLTEWPSLIPQDHTILEQGMVLTLEPSIATEHGRFLVHEENIVIEENGARYLSHPWTSELKIIP